jgi:predicted nucleotidyltransferase
MSSALSKDIIINTLTNHHLQLKNFGVEQIGLFGSHAFNKANKHSDIDLLVELRKEKKTFRNYMSLVYYLEELFKCKVEVITKQSLSPFIGPHILKTVEYVSFSD